MFTLTAAEGSWVRPATWASLCATMFCAGALGASVEWSATEIRPETSRITFVTTGLAFRANYAVDFQFDPAQVRELSNAVVPLGFDALLLQPDNPPGASGDLSVMALRDVASDVPLTFRVDVRMSSAQLAADQGLTFRFALFELDEQGRIEATLASGVANNAFVPEPATLPLAGAALLLVTAYRAIRKRGGRESA